MSFTLNSTQAEAVAFILGLMARRTIIGKFFYWLSDTLSPMAKRHTQAKAEIRELLLKQGYYYDSTGKDVIRNNGSEPVTLTDEMVYQIVYLLHDLKAIAMTRKSVEVITTVGYGVPYYYHDHLATLEALSERLKLHLKENDETKL